MSLSERIRPNVEAAPWVLEEIKTLESELERLRIESDEHEIDCRIWRRRYEQAMGDLEEALGEIQRLRSELG